MGAADGRQTGEQGFRRIACPLKRKMCAVVFLCSGQYSFPSETAVFKKTCALNALIPRFQREKCVPWDSRTGPGLVVAFSCQRPVHLRESALGAPPVTAQSSAHSAGLSRGRRNTRKKPWSISVVTLNSLRKPRNEATESAAFRTRAFCGLVAAARRSSSVLSRAGPSW